MQVLLALAAYDEERGLPQVLERFGRVAAQGGLEARIVVVDDGSTDGTGRVIREWAARLPIETIRHPENRGLGETIQDALEAAARLAQPQDIIVTMDADNTHAPELIPAMMRRLAEGCDVVIASRYRQGSKVVGLSAFRHAMSHGARLLFQACLPTRGVRDYTCSFRAYRASVLQEAFQRSGGRLVTERGFAAAAEILLYLRRWGARMCEVPLVLRYDQKGSASKMNVVRTVLATLRLLARYRLAALFGATPTAALPGPRR